MMDINADAEITLGEQEAIGPPFGQPLAPYAGAPIPFMSVK
jgi:hypothetical protein